MRLNILQRLMINAGMRLAITPRAGFFTLWETPSNAFGEPISSAAEFNFMMIERTGVVGVHFGNFMGYAVCADIKSIETALADAFQAADPAYD